LHGREFSLLYNPRSLKGVIVRLRTPIKRGELLTVHLDGEVGQSKCRGGSEQVLYGPHDDPLAQGDASMQIRHCPNPRRNGR